MDATGITLSQKQAAYAANLLERQQLTTSAKVEQQDYRDLSTQTQYDRIVCLELIEHVGFKNLGQFAERVYEVLNDNGLFVLQWTGLRRSVKPEDMIWGLFVSKFIYPGADAALPPSTMMKTFEKAGFEVHSIENISGHYALTLRQWRKNWLSTKKPSSRHTASERFGFGTSSWLGRSSSPTKATRGCYQAVLHKNLDGFDRKRWLSETEKAPRDEVAAGGLENVTPIKRAVR